jgi:hypothetical protein
MSTVPIEPDGWSSFEIAKTILAVFWLIFLALYCLIGMQRLRRFPRSIKELVEERPVDDKEHDSFSKRFGWGGAKIYFCLFFLLAVLLFTGVLQ